MPPLGGRARVGLTRISSTGPPFPDCRAQMRNRACETRNLVPLTESDLTSNDGHVALCLAEISKKSHREVKGIAAHPTASERLCRRCKASAGIPIGISSVAQRVGVMQLWMRCRECGDLWSIDVPLTGAAGPLLGLSFRRPRGRNRSALSEFEVIVRPNDKWAHATPR